jgi:hypothetical protein
MNNIIFFNIGWMTKYQGKTKFDDIIGGGMNVWKTKYGHEIFNFLNCDGYCYGYVQPSNYSYKIKIERLGASIKDDSLENVLVVWTARNPDKGGVYIVGWYENATVYRDYQENIDKKRIYKGEAFDFFAKAKIKDCHLLPIVERTMRVPRGKGGMGQSNVWFADNNPKFVNKIRESLHNRISHSTKTPLRKSFKPIDQIKKLKIEESAIKVVCNYFEKIDYQVKSVEKDNVGWDLEATCDETKLKLEVKGLSGNTTSVELTPNEYEQMKKDPSDYRLCIVTKALQKKPLLEIFYYSKKRGKLISEDNKVLIIDEKTSARIFEK